MNVHYCMNLRLRELREIAKWEPKSINDLRYIRLPALDDPDVMMENIQKGGDKSKGTTKVAGLFASSAGKDTDDESERLLGGHRFSSTVAAIPFCGGHHFGRS